MIPRVDVASYYLYGLKFSSNTVISTNKGPCGTLSDPTHNQETACDYWANEVILTRTCSEAPCLLGVCSLGILADCNCEETGFTSSDVGAKKFIGG